MPLFLITFSLHICVTIGDKKVKISFSTHLSVISQKYKVCKDILIHIIFW